MKRAGTILFVFLIAWTRPLQAPDTTVVKDAGYRFKALASPHNSESLFVALTFSGGGTRAAALAHGVLDELRKTTIEWEGRESSLLDEVDVISSVSGGSVTAAHYALWRGRHFERFGPNFLQRRAGWRMLWSGLAPHRFWRLLSRQYNRSEIAADYWDSSLFGGATYRDLAKEGRPFLVLNAADLSQSARFEFTQYQFDYLCQDLGGFSLARAVAASSAFPGPFTPVRIENRGDRCGAEDKEAKLARADRLRNPSRYAKATALLSYRNASERPYVNLVDGGITDNLGVHSIVDALNLDLSSIELPPPASGKLKKLVVIVVDAKTVTDLHMDQTASVPGLIATATASVSAPIATSSSHMMDHVRMKLNELHPKKEQDPKIETYLIHVSFDAIPENKEKDARKFKLLPTNFTLAPDLVAEVVKVGGEILRNDEEFQRLKGVLAP